MAETSATKRSQNGERTITLPIGEDHYAEIIHDAERFRAERLDPNYADHPELFPVDFEKGYEMKGHYHAKRQNIDIRRIILRERVWNVYYAETRTIMGQRIRRLREWAMKNLSGVVLAPLLRWWHRVLDLCAKSNLWGVWYDHPDGHATSNMLDRLMRSQNRYFDRGQHFHGDLKSANLRSRAWAILHNYWPWCPESVKDNDGATSATTSATSATTSANVTLKRPGHRIMIFMTIDFTIQ